MKNNSHFSFRNSHFPKGFSVVEVILAVGLFMIFATGIVTVVLWGLDNNRLSGEQTIASQYAAEGLEMAKSSRNQAYANLVNGTTNAAFDKYSRAVVISDVQRDGSGNIIDSGGTVDVNTKKIVSIVSWNVNSARANSVVLTTYLTDWKTAVAPTPAPTPSTCSEYAVSQGFGSGTCRQNPVQCTNNGETNLSAGDTYCTGGPSADICCALAGPTLTPTTAPTSAPTPTLTPTNCSEYCVSLGTYTTGTCRKGVPQCTSNGETYENGGNPLCTQAEGGTCCCKP